MFKLGGWFICFALAIELATNLHKDLSLVPCELYLALTQDSETADDGDEDAIAVIFVVDHGDIVAVVRPAHIVSQGPRQAGHVRWEALIHHLEFLEININLTNIIYSVSVTLWHVLFPSKSIKIYIQHLEHTSLLTF